MSDHIPLSRKIKEAAQKGLLDALGEAQTLEWIAGALELESSAHQIAEVKTWLRQAECEIRKRKRAFQADDVMKQLHWSGWESLGVVKGALHEMCSDGDLVVVDHGTPNIYSYTYMNK